ncbi:caspase family protein [Aeromicrobium massiliense]|uniref:caspase family protein n=1 Tax=Aeromicrobium massiliense TaxID=1464554 RepID=UPI0009D91B05|nr:caspase family protein [Aeromicrobium massiliense]
MKRALLVGNDTYKSFGNLSGCVEDVKALQPLLARHENGEPNFECVTETDLTRDELIGAIGRLLAPGADSALFFFAGHGGKNVNDVVLCTSDGTENSPGVAFSDVLGMIASSPLQEVVILLDCCFAGGAGNVPALASDGATLKPGLSILAASRGDQTSAETEARRGLFSTFVEGALDGGAADTLGSVDLGNLYAYVSESFGAWEQRPTFKANISRPLELRKCEPILSSGDLRRILNLFEHAFSRYPLNPSYEPTEDPKHEENEAIFRLLQKARASRLVEPVEEDHLYFAAMNSGACELTALGRHYHQVNREGRL